MADDITLAVNGRRISGWTQIRIGAGIESCPRSFDLSLTEAFPKEPMDVPVQPGDQCEVFIGEDQIISGFVDRFAPRYSPRQHAIQVSGRGRCQDFVDCSAEWPTGQISGSSPLAIAVKLAEAYPGLIVETDVDADVGTIPQFPLLLGETPFDLIERIARYRGLLVYETAEGHLLLTRAGTVKAASGFVEGVNVQEGSATFAMDQRYSEIMSVRQTVNPFGDVDDGNVIWVETDADVKRHRRLIVIPETVAQGDLATARQRALWEVARRFGRGNVVEIVTDSWRDAAGALWAPNTLVPLSMPTLKVEGKIWLIANVSFERSEEAGTIARLTIMPPEAFQPEPLVSLQPGFSDVPIAAGGDATSGPSSTRALL